MSNATTASAADFEALQDIAPVTANDRIETLDFIRGLAVMGILAANIVAFGQPFDAYMWPDGFLVSDGDPGRWQWIAQFTLIDGKMRGLFTLLFGAGLYLFMERAWARGGTRWLQMWRLFILMVFGMIHFYLIWPGDILFYYAVIGFLVVPCLKWSVKAQFWTGLIASIFGGLFYVVFMSPLYLAMDTQLGEAEGFSEMRAGLEAGKADTLAKSALQTDLIQSGDYAGLVAYRVTEQWHEPLTNVLLFSFEMLPLMLLGVALYRFGFFSGAFNPRKMKLWGWAGLLLGGLVHLGIGLVMQDGGFTYYGTLAAFVGWAPLPRLAMTLGLAALLVAYSPGWTGWLAERVRAAGRAAFTNYLGTSIVMLFIMHGWALGLFGQLNRPELYLLTLAMWMLMLAWSKPWLERHRYGPLEWLWRCLTYRKAFPLKR